MRLSSGFGESSGTLALVAKRVQARGATRVVIASPISHSWANSAPDIVTRISDALVMFLRDRQFYVNGHWQDYPELAGAIAMDSKGEEQRP